MGKRKTTKCDQSNVGNLNTHDGSKCSKNGARIANDNIIFSNTNNINNVSSVVNVMNSCKSSINVDKTQSYITSKLNDILDEEGFEDYLELHEYNLFVESLRS